jgi:hypothetical protein
MAVAVVVIWAVLVGQAVVVKVLIQAHQAQYLELLAQHQELLIQAAVAVLVNNPAVQE